MVNVLNEDRFFRLETGTLKKIVLNIDKEQPEPHGQTPLLSRLCVSLRRMLAPSSLVPKTILSGSAIS